jgi:hypothetical protein
MNPRSGIQKGISLTFCEFELSALGQEESLNSCCFKLIYTPD